MKRIDNELGNISIAGDVFVNLAGEAATNCFGVKGMAGKSKGESFYSLLRRESMAKGVSVNFDEDGAVSIALHIVVDHGVNISALGRSIVSEVRYKVESATGVEVKSVDVFVDSMVLD